MIFGRENSIETGDLSKIFDYRNCPELASKPKFFIIYTRRCKMMGPGALVTDTTATAPHENQVCRKTAY